MVQRGFAEAREAARLERRQTEMSRQLSTFLADASLALDASDSLEEMLRLVAEQARELVGADCCVATVAVDGQPRTRRRRPPTPRPTGAGRRSSDGSTCSRSTGVIRAERRLGEDRRRAARSPASVPHRGQRSAASGMARRIADRPRRQRARARSSSSTSKAEASPGTTRPLSSISPRWRRRPSREHGSTTSEASRATQSRRSSRRMGADRRASTAASTCVPARASRAGTAARTMTRTSRRTGRRRMARLQLHASPRIGAEDHDTRRRRATHAHPPSDQRRPGTGLGHLETHVAHLDVAMGDTPDGRHVREPHPGTVGCAETVATHAAMTPSVESGRLRPRGATRQAPRWRRP